MKLIKFYEEKKISIQGYYFLNSLPIRGDFIKLIDLNESFSNSGICLRFGPDFDEKGNFREILGNEFNFAIYALLDDFNRLKNKSKFKIMLPQALCNLENILFNKNN